MHQVGYLPGISAGCTDNKTLNFNFFTEFNKNYIISNDVNPSSGKSVGTFGQTDRHDEGKGQFSTLCERAYSVHITYKYSFRISKKTHCASDRKLTVQ
jgi:hypothetical protein